MAKGAKRKDTHRIAARPIRMFYFRRHRRVFLRTRRYITLDESSGIAYSATQ